MTGKAPPDDLAGRIRELRSDPSNDRISRVERAGEIVDGHLVTHNGLLVRPDDAGYLRLLQGNSGCQAPQEDLLFQSVLSHLPAGSCILELGSYWAFYSMWFARAVPSARCFLVEPRKKNIESGRHNFRRNGLRSEFYRFRVGHGHLRVDDFIAARRLSRVDVLHADIQGDEYEMLRGAENSLRRGRIGYVFLGTHDQLVHYRCKSFLEQHGYLILAHADFDHGTYCCDGVLVARQRDLPGMEPLDIPLRDTAGQRRAEEEMSNLPVDRQPCGRRSLEGLLRRISLELACFRERWRE